MKMFDVDELVRLTGGTLYRPPRPDFSVEAVNTDSRANVGKSLFIAIPGERVDGHDFLESAIQNGAVLVCVERRKIAKVPDGFPCLAVDSTLEAYHALAAAYRRRFDVLVAGLTGSSGKTSTKEMIRAIFNRHFGAEHVLATEGNTNNHIGVPQNLFRLTPEIKAAVIEMGTNHHGEIAPLAWMAKPRAGLIVSIGRCHLENLGSLRGVAREKGHLYRFLPHSGTAVIPNLCAGHAELLKAAGKRKKVFFGQGGMVETRYLGGNINGSSFELIDNRSGEKIRVDWKLSGRHQAENAAGAAALALTFDIPLHEIAEGLTACTLPGMRMKITEYHGTKWINDAYNANPDSMKATLEWLHEFADPEKLLLILGDMLETGEQAKDLHRGVLATARELFPKGAIAAVGPVMSSVAAEFENVTAFPDSSAAAAGIREMWTGKELVFLKASRGTRLEKVVPE